MKRRPFLSWPVLAIPLLGAGCSVLPDRPFIESQRFPLQPRREGPPGARTRHAILVRGMRAAPGLEQRGLRRVQADGRVEIAPYEEWLAPPADLAELALREWLVASGRFTAVTSPGSRLETSLIIETELIAIQIEPAGARVALSGLLLGQGGGIGTPRPLGQIRLEARISLQSATSAAHQTATMQAAAMETALGRLLADLESWLVSIVSV